MNAYDPEPWTDFAAATAGAAAALAGLLFVAVSINIQAILASPGTTGRAAQAVVLLVSPVFLCLVVLIPGQPPAALGTELVVLGVVVGVLLSPACRPSRRSPHQPLASWLITTVAASLGVTLGALLAGLGLIVGGLGGLFWLPVAVVTGLAGGLVIAWVLLIEILR